LQVTEADLTELCDMCPLLTCLTQDHNRDRPENPCSSTFPGVQAFERLTDIGFVVDQTFLHRLAQQKNTGFPRCTTLWVSNASNLDAETQEAARLLPWGDLFPNVRDLTVFGTGIAGMFRQFPNLTHAGLHTMPLRHVAQQLRDMRHAQQQQQQPQPQQLQSLNVHCSLPIEGDTAISADLLQQCLMPSLRRLCVFARRVEMPREVFLRWLAAAPRDHVHIYGLPQVECSEERIDMYIDELQYNRLPVPGYLVLDWHDDA
jgi:hypothetical protein